MKITDITVKSVSLKMTKPLKVTFGEIDTVKSLILVIHTDADIVGVGEACPFEPVTGESLATELAALPVLIQAVYGQDPINIENIHRLMNDTIIGHTALKAGIDMALYDILGKRTNLPVYKLLGGSNNHIITDITISINDSKTMAADAKNYVDQGFTQLKVKAGLNPEQDEEAIQAIFDKIGDAAVLKIDANQGWSPKKTIQVMNRFSGSRLEIVEQPLPAWQTNANSLIRGEISQGLMLDESVHSSHDAFKVLQNESADVINIKLMKSSGIFDAEAINRLAEAAGIPCMIGCMAESRLGIAAAVHFAAAHENVKYCDLDSFMMLDEQGWLTGGFTRKGEMLTLTEEPGLGIHLK